MGSPDVTPDQFETASKLVKEICSSEDDAFIVGLLDSIVKKDAAGYASKHGYKVSNPTDWKAVKALGTPGPHFSLRVAGGAYRFGDNNLGLYELFVNSCKETIHVDGEPVANLKVDQGNVTFTTKDGKNFKIQFQCAQLPGDERSDPLFKGDILSGSSHTQNTAVTGTKFYPWGNSSDKDKVDGAGRLIEDIPRPGPGISKAKILAAATVRVDAAMDSISVCLDMIRGHCDQDTEEAEAFFSSMQLSVPIEVYLGGFGLLICTVMAATGGYLMEKDPEHKWERAGGMAFAASAAYIIGTVVSLTKTKCISRPSSEMGAFIRQYGDKGDPTDQEADRLLTWDIIEKTVDEKVANLSHDDLKDEPKTHFDTIRKSVAGAYKVKARGDIGLPTFRKFRGLRHLDRATYDKVFDEEVNSKFDNDVSQGLLDKLMERKIKKRKAEVESMTLKEHIAELVAKQIARVEARDKEISDMKAHTPDDKKQEEEEKINEKYKQELQEIEEGLRRDTDARKKADEDAKVDVDGALEDIKKEIRESRKTEREAQAKSHTGGK